jgi:hypothetical protein
MFENRKVWAIVHKLSQIVVHRTEMMEKDQKQSIC